MLTTSKSTSVVAEVRPAGGDGPQPPELYIEYKHHTKQLRDPPDREDVGSLLVHSFGPVATSLSIRYNVRGSLAFVFPCVKSFAFTVKRTFENSLI
jgi:hypothetical protein